MPVNLSRPQSRHLVPFTRDSARELGARGRATIKRRAAERDRLLAQAAALASMDAAERHFASLTACLLALHDAIAREQDRTPLRPGKLRDLVKTAGEVRRQLLTEEHARRDQARPARPGRSAPIHIPPRAPAAGPGQAAGAAAASSNPAGNPEPSEPLDPEPFTSGE